MKIISIFPMIIGATFLLSGTAVNAAKTATAPADYLAKKNPYSVDDMDSIKKAAKKLYKKNCKKCHGKTGNGKGPGAEDMDPAPTAFNEPGYLKGRKDGQLFWITEKGSKDTEMEGFGAGSEKNLSEDEIWQIITYMRSQFTK